MNKNNIKISIIGMGLISVIVSVVGAVTSGSYGLLPFSILIFLEFIIPFFILINIYSYFSKQQNSGLKKFLTSLIVTASAFLFFLIFDFFFNSKGEPFIGFFLKNLGEYSGFIFMLSAFMWFIHTYYSRVMKKNND